MYKADLHIHTTSSDGLLSPKEVVKYAKKNNLRAIAITDHDTVDGIDEAIKHGDEIGILVIPGIEFSCIYNDSEIHVLGLFIDYKSSLYKDISNKLGKYRYDRGKKIVKKLNDLGVNITLEEVQSICNNNVIGRPHIGRVLVDKGYVKNLEEAFDVYLGNGKLAYVPRYKLKINEAVDIIHKTNGVSILAHPGLYSIDIECILNEFNIDGIEVFHSKHTKKDEMIFKDMAKEKNIIFSGGSDWHGGLDEDSFLIGKNYINFSALKEYEAFNDYILRREQ